MRTKSDIDKAYKPNGITDNRKKWRKKMIELNYDNEMAKYFKRIARNTL